MKNHRLKIIFVLLLGILLPAFTHAQKFYPDDPLWEDPDRLPIPIPERQELSSDYDLYENSFKNPGGTEQVKAQNVNTLGEVPDSSWFTNRIGRNPMSIEDLVRGPNDGKAPDTSGPITIITSKRQGITRGFTIQDSKGDVYFLKFDPPGYPQLTTSAEVISTKFFYAFGYNVPENYITFIKREQLRIGPDARVPISKSQSRQMTEEDIDEVWHLVPQTSDGRIQAMASRLIPGEILGQFRYYGTRPDDSNDIFLHQNRRDLRGLCVFASWLNNEEVQLSNTLDAFIAQNEKGYVKHYMLDFSSTLGSGNARPKSRRAGNEYFVEFPPILKSAYTLGLWDRPWRKIPYPNYPSIGRFEAAYFDPPNWKTEYPNPAFLKMENEDAFWATKIVMRFSNEMIRAIVQTGQLIDKEAENYLVETLIQRKEKIVNYYLSQLNPLDEFLLTKTSTNRVDFKNLGLEAGLSKEASYQYQWYSFDNIKMTQLSIGDSALSSSASIEIPDSSSEYLMLRINTISPNQPNWKKNVDIYLKNDAEMKIVGIDREN